MIRKMVKPVGVLLLLLLPLLATKAYAVNIVRVLTITESLAAPGQSIQIRESGKIVAMPGVRFQTQTRQAVTLHYHGGKSEWPVISQRIQQKVIFSGFVGETHSYVPVWVKTLTISVPRHYVAGGWDVRALQQELERLGVKVKPKPVTPKPANQVSS